jgi:hypothetical protein
MDVTVRIINFFYENNDMERVRNLLLLRSDYDIEVVMDICSLNNDNLSVCFLFERCGDYLSAINILKKITMELESDCDKLICIIKKCVHLSAHAPLHQAFQVIKMSLEICEPININLKRSSPNREDVERSISELYAVARSRLTTSKKQFYKLVSCTNRYIAYN